MYYFEGFELDPARFELRHHDRPVPMEPQVFEVLAFLVENAGRIVLKDELIEHIWPERYITEAALNSRLMAARKAIGDNGRDQRLIRTVHGRGYRFVGELQPAPVAAAAGGQIAGASPSNLGPGAVAGAPGPALAYGREHEMRFLEAAWQRACEGRRQMVFVTGEAGIGKSTLVGSFLAQVANLQGPRCTTGQCLELTGPGEAFLPVLDALGRLLAGGRDTEAAGLLARLAPSWLAQLPGLLSAETVEEARAAALGANRDRMLREVLTLLDALSAEEPLLIVLEDLHWSDPSTTDFLGAVARRTAPARLLVLATYRHGDEGSGDIHRLQRELRVRGACSELAIGRLDAAVTEELLATRFPDAKVPGDLVSHLLQRSGGNPLFLTGLVSHLTETGALRLVDGSMAWDPQLAQAATPPDLRDLLLLQHSRLDPLEREVLSAAAVVGPEFTTDLIAPLVDESVEAVEQVCDGLVERGPFLRHSELRMYPGAAISPAFAFVHDLYRDVLEASNTPSRRLRLHRQVGETLERLLSGRTDSRASELAAHFELARDHLRAIRYRRAAATQAFARSGYVEALGHLEAALRMLEAEDIGPEGPREEMYVRAAMGPTLVSMRGFGVAEAEASWRRTLELARTLGDGEYAGAAILGLVTLLEYQGRHAEAEELLRVLETLRATTSEEARMPFHALLSCSTFHRGSFSRALEHGKLGLETTAALGPDPRWALFGEEPANGCLEWSALAMWFLGHPDAAVARIEEAVRDAEQPGRRYALASALTHAARVRQLRREPALCEEYARRVILIAGEHGFAYHEATARVLLGWALASQGNRDEGFELIRRGIDEHRSTGASMDRPYFLALLAEQLIAAGDNVEAAELISQALREVGEDEFFYSAELYRLRASIAADDASAEADLEESLAVARRQQAPGLELRAATALASRLAPTHPARARDLVTPLLASFSEGLDTADVTEARALLSRL